MAKKYTEFVIAGTFELVKGFLLGYRCGKANEFSYFFHRKSGIRRDTLREKLKEMLELDTYVHLCLENDMLPGFRKAVEEVKPLIGLAIKKERQVKAASFNFSFTINNREAGQRVKGIFSSLPEGLALEGYQPREESQREGKTRKTGGYAPLHPYEFSGSGTARGGFGEVMELFLRIKRLPESELILTGEIGLDFGE